MKNNYKHSLHKLLITGLRDLYTAENDTAFILPEMINAAGSAVLRKAFHDHLDNTEKNIKRLNRIFKLIERRPKADKRAAIRQIIKEGKYPISLAVNHSTARDLELISIAQKMEHYSITAYVTLAELADELLLDKVAKRLLRTYNKKNLTVNIYEDMVAKTLSSIISIPLVGAVA
ncbi:MAG: DUF892 family protein [Chitinophagaceae bacterium]|nr:DUF892 family protein [Chitinophagaceae bacterium]